MNKIIFLTLFCINANKCLSQTSFPYQDILLEKASDYKQAEPIALSAASLILSTPYKKDDKEKLHALAFLINWMTGTKEYHFYLQNLSQEILEDRELFGLYNAAMAKFCIENKSISTNQNLVQSSAYKMVLDYCDNPSNNFKLKKRARKQLTNN